MVALKNRSAAAALPLETRILVGDNGYEHETNWAEFIEANRDGICTWELSLIAVKLQAGETYRGGGGAEGRWSVRRTPSTLVILACGKRYPIPDFATASRLVDEARNITGVRASRFTAPLIFDGDRVVAHVSYNGRVWAGEPRAWTPGSLPLFDNRITQRAH